MPVQFIFPFWQNESASSTFVVLISSNIVLKYCLKSSKYISCWTCFFLRLKNFQNSFGFWFFNLRSPNDCLILKPLLFFLTISLYPFLQLQSSTLFACDWLILKLCKASFYTRRAFIQLPSNHSWYAYTFSLSTFSKLLYMENLFYTMFLCFCARMPLKSKQKSLVALITYGKHTIVVCLSSPLVHSKLSWTGQTVWGASRRKRTCLRKKL